MAPPTKGEEVVHDPTDVSLRLDTLQPEKQRHILETIVKLRKCGLEQDLSLPQICACGDQSSGKSSIMEALTGIPFPRADNLCTRFATEINLKYADSDGVTVGIIPDSSRSASEQVDMEEFGKSVNDASDLPSLMNKARRAMGIGSDGSDPLPRAFANDVLSIDIEGPDRPQLTLVDLPGLFQNKTKGISEEDKVMVQQLTERYISKPRTICLAVVAATNDYANQGILDKVQEFDRAGDRSVGIITKPDMIPRGSGAEKSFIALAKNEDVFFKLGCTFSRIGSLRSGTLRLPSATSPRRLGFEIPTSIACQQTV